MTISPDGPANLALSDLALNAAIELERFQGSSKGDLNSVVELAKALSEKGLSDLALVPVYDRALASGGASVAATKNDLYSRLQKIAAQLQSMNTASPKDLELLPRNAHEFEASEGKMHYVPFGRQFVIHPGRFVLGITLEWVRVPETLGGYITGKSSMGRTGLIIETAAGLHPCFSGCIALEISNCGEVPIALIPGMRICQVFFHRVSRRSPHHTTSFGGRRRPTFGNYKPDDIVARSMPMARDPNHGSLFEGG
jgi:deoxycytidine triphosphate deaminase